MFRDVDSSHQHTRVRACTCVRASACVCVLARVCVYVRVFATGRMTTISSGPTMQASCVIVPFSYTILPHLMPLYLKLSKDKFSFTFSSVSLPWWMSAAYTATMKKMTRRDISFLIYMTVLKCLLQAGSRIMQLSDYKSIYITSGHSLSRPFV